jgi:hypothetical protein
VMDMMPYFKPFKAANVINIMQRCPDLFNQTGAGVWPARLMICSPGRQNQAPNPYIRI